MWSSENNNGLGPLSLLGTYSRAFGSFLPNIEIRTPLDPAEEVIKKEEKGGQSRCQPAARFQAREELVSRQRYIALNGI